MVASVREVRWALEDPDGLLERIAHDSNHALITLTVSEKGYRIDPATDRLRLDDPDIAADLEHGTSRTVIGQIVQGLERAGGAPAALRSPCSAATTCPATVPWWPAWCATSSNIFRWPRS